MFKKIAIALGALAIVGCSSQQASQTQDQINAIVVNLFHNAGATACTPATVAAVEANFPNLVPPAQLTTAVNFACSTLFGVNPAPLPAPGNNPVFPAVPVTK